MDRRVILALCLVALLALAGCSTEQVGELPDPGNTTAPTDAPTAGSSPEVASEGPRLTVREFGTEVPLDDATFPPDSNASGLATDGLWEAHKRVLGRTDYVYWDNRTSRRNGSRGGLVGIIRSDLDGERMNASYTATGARARSGVDVKGEDIYIGNGTDYRRITEDGQVGYRVNPRDDYERSHEAISLTVREGVQALEDMEAVAAYERDGHTLVRYEGEYDWDYLQTEVDTHDRESAEIVVDERGVVWHVELHATGTIADEGPVALHSRFTLLELGNVTVEKPGWVDAAREQATTQP